MANFGHVGRVQCTGADDPLREWLSLFNDALESQDREAVLNLFLPQAFWRDFLAFTWNLHTSEGREAIGDMLDACLARTAPRAWRMVGTAREAGDVIEAIAAFETEIGRCSAVIRLKEGRCSTSSRR